MNKLIVTVLVSAFLFVACNCPQSQQQNEPQQSKRDIVLENIHSRKSVRNFIEGKQIPKEDIETLLKAAMAAPTAVNLQPWHFIVVDNRADLDALNQKLPYAKMLEKASAAIIVCGDTEIKAGDLSFWELDCSLASANILLAAEAMGLGALWTAVYPTERTAFVQEYFNMPANIVPLNLIPIGYPTGEDKPKDKYKPEKIHYNKW